jgi:hypothetical protein
MHGNRRKCFASLCSRFHKQSTDHPVADPGLRDYAARRGWTIALQGRPVAVQSALPLCEKLVDGDVAPRDRLASPLADTLYQEGVCSE